MVGGAVLLAPASASLLRRDVDRPDLLGADLRDLPVLAELALEVAAGGRQRRAPSCRAARGRTASSRSDRGGASRGASRPACSTRRRGSRARRRCRAPWSATRQLRGQSPHSTRSRRRASCTSARGGPAGLRPPGRSGPGRTRRPARASPRSRAGRSRSRHSRRRGVPSNLLRSRSASVTRPPPRSSPRSASPSRASRAPAMYRGSRFSFASASRPTSLRRASITLQATRVDRDRIGRGEQPRGTATTSAAAAPGPPWHCGAIASITVRRSLSRISGNAARCGDVRIAAVVVVLVRVVDRAVPVLQPDATRRPGRGP